MAFITYDVSGRQDEVKRGMLASGYSDHWRFGDVLYYLPNTSLWKNNTTPTQAVKDLQAVVAKLNDYPKVTLVRCITTEDEPWDGIPGDADR